MSPLVPHREVVVKRFRCEFRRSARVVEVAEDTVLLQQALRGGIRPSYSCQSGGCGACMVQVLEGEVDQWGRCITEEEKARGYVLLCSAYPRSDLVLDA